MAVTTALAIYFLVWWLVLFAVLPFGVRSQHEGEDYAPGTDPGAPIVSRMAVKLAWTTGIATLVFAILAAIYKSHIIDVAALMNWIRPAR
jgi:predicted secreted protein